MSGTSIGFIMTLTIILHDLDHLFFEPEYKKRLFFLEIPKYMKKVLFILLLCFWQTVVSAQGHTFRAMTWNIRYDNPADGQDAWPLRRERVVALIRFHMPDVLGIQEGLAHQVEYLKNELPEYAFAGAGRDDGKNGGEFSALFFRKARFHASETGVFWLSPSPDTPSKGWDAALNRVCTYAVLEDLSTGAELTVLNTHFDHRGDTARLRSAELLLQKLADWNQPGRAVLVMGDFNAEPDSAPIRALTGALQDSKAACQTQPYGPEGTFNAFQPAATAELDKRIDYVFVRDLHVRRYGVLTDQHQGRYPSDHLPVLVDLERVK